MFATSVLNCSKIQLLAGLYRIMLINGKLMFIINYNTMKHLLTCCLFLFLGLCFSQGNLQFNQVLTFTGTVTSNNGFVNSAINTVPLGKVWKIEHVGGSTSLMGNGTQYGITINNATSICYWGSSPANQLLKVKEICPIWLKSGDNISFYWSQYNQTQSCDFIISIVEFNLIP